LRAAGFSAAELARAGFTAQEMVDAGYTAKELSSAGYSLAELKAAGFSASDLAKAGFTAGDLAKAGFTVKDLAEAGFTAQELTNAGFSAADLQAAGVANTDLGNTGAGSASALAIAMAGGAPGSANASAQSEADKIRAEQAKAISLQEYRNKLALRSNMMRAQAAQLINTYSPKTSNQQLIIGSPLPDPVEKPLSATTAAPTQQRVSDMLTGKMSSEIITAGSAFYAVLDAEIDSNVDQPVLATIVSGPLTGSKLLGRFKVQNLTSLVLAFDKIQIPNISRSSAISVFAIDVNTVQNVTVDHRTMQKYGAMFASSFLSGVGDAVLKFGNQSVTNRDANGSTTTTSSPLANAELITVGLGQVGKAWSNEVKKLVSLPPRINMKKGATFGVLIMSDFTLPTNV
jgi:intracellular multiplication protein IcmE